MAGPKDKPDPKIYLENIQLQLEALEAEVKYLRLELSKCLGHSVSHKLRVDTKTKHVPPTIADIAADERETVYRKSRTMSKTVAGINRRNKASADAKEKAKLKSILKPAPKIKSTVRFSHFKS